MGTRLALATFMEQCLADNAAERTQLERVGVIAKWAFCWHHTRISTLFLTMVTTFLELATMIISSDRAYTTDALVRFCRAHPSVALIGFHRAYATSGGSRERAERAHDYSLVLPCRKWDKKHEVADLDHQIYHMIVQQKFHMYVCVSRVQVLVQKQIVGIKSLGLAPAT
jgi:hypothetical protein